MNVILLYEIMGIYKRESSISLQFWRNFKRAFLKGRFLDLVNFGFGASVQTAQTLSRAIAPSIIPAHLDIAPMQLNIHTTRVVFIWRLWEDVSGQRCIPAIDTAIMWVMPVSAHIFLSGPYKRVKKWPDPSTSRKKTRCTAERPICSFCLRLNVQCVYLPRGSTLVDGVTKKPTVDAR